ncbi:MAG TPA: serine/threonine-protein kinase [Thermoanaerobaculia bacterium]|nr:serine/threonine-protein kinase [Thermoanaerobaculia bacterium]
MTRSDHDFEGIAPRGGERVRSGAVDTEPTVVLREAADPAARDGALESSPAGSLDSSLARREHTADIERFHQAAIAGLFLWPGFAIFDWAVHRWVEPIHIEYFLGVRAGFTVPILLFLWATASPGRMSARTLRWLDAGFFGTASLLLGFMAVDFRGLASPYAPGLSLVVVCRAAFVAWPWRASLLTTSLPALAFPAALVLATPWNETIRAQWSDPAALTMFVYYESFLLSVAATALLGGHVVWSLRRRVFEARAVGRYRLTRRLGQGAMGDVWAAAHPRLKQEVAVKLLHEDLGQSTKALERFEREVQATAELSHPNTVRILDYGVTDDGLWYYTMELLRGVHLADLVAESGALPPDRAAWIALQAAYALGEAHDAGIVHRDIKPENVFVIRAGRQRDSVKVLDFGIAKRPTPDGTRLTEVGAVIGTPRYLSPEAAQGKPTDARSDVYSLASVLYFLLTGSPPFQDEFYGALLVAHVERPVTPPSERLGGPLPEGLAAIAMRGLEKDPAARYRDANEMAEALERWLRGG